MFNRSSLAGGLTTALSPRSLMAEEAVSPLFEALLQLAKQPTMPSRPSRGRHGLIDAAPIDAWLKRNGKLVDQEVINLESRGQLTVERCVNLLRAGIPTIVQDELLGPSRYDPEPPTSFQCRIPDLEMECSKVPMLPANVMVDDAFLQKAVRALIILCLQCYLGAFLARGEDAVLALHYPGDSQLNLNPRQRYAIGFVREVVIFKHFPSLALFWETFKKMYEQGEHYAGFFDGINHFDPDQVRKLFADDPMAFDLYSVLMEVTRSSERLTRVIEFVEYYWDHPMENTIGDPTLAKRMADNEEDL